MRYLPSPEELYTDAQASSRYHNVGLLYLYQLVYAKFDMKIHIDNGATFPFHRTQRSDANQPFFPESEDYATLFNKLKEDIFLVKTGATTPGHAAFGHILGGYDAGYYGYTSLFSATSRLLV